MLRPPPFIEGSGRLSSVVGFGVAVGGVGVDSSLSSASSFLTSALAVFISLSSGSLGGGLRFQQGQNADDNFVLASFLGHRGDQKLELQSLGRIGVVADSVGAEFEHITVDRALVDVAVDGVRRGGAGMYVGCGSCLWGRAGDGLRGSVADIKKAFGLSPREQMLRQEVGVAHERGSKLVGGQGG